MGPQRMCTHPWGWVGARGSPTLVSVFSWNWPSSRPRTPKFPPECPKSVYTSFGVGPWTPKSLYTSFGVGPRTPSSLYTSFGVGPLTPSTLYTSLGVGGGERVTKFGVSFLVELAI